MTAHSSSEARKDIGWKWTLGQEACGFWPGLCRFSRMLRKISNILLRNGFRNDQVTLVRYRGADSEARERSKDETHHSVVGHHGPDPVGRQRGGAGDHQDRY